MEKEKAGFSSINKIIAVDLSCLILCATGGCGSTSSSDEPSDNVSSSSDEETISTNESEDSSEPEVEKDTSENHESGKVLMPEWERR